MGNSKRLMLILAMVAAVVMVGSLPAFAQQKKGGKGKGGNQNNQNQNQNNPNGTTTTNPPGNGNVSGSTGDVPVDAAIAGEKVKADASVLQEAQDMVTRTQAEMDGVVAAKRAEFDKTPEVQKLIQQVADDQKNLDTITAAIQTKIAAAHPEYPALVTTRDAAKKKLDQVTAAKAEKEEIVFRTYQFKEADGAVKEIDDQYFGNDGKYAAAVKLLKEDNEKLAKAREGVNAELAKDGDYQAMALTLSSAKTKLAALQAKASASTP